MGRKRLPALDFGMTMGEITKINPYLLGPVGLELGQNGDHFKEYETYGQTRGSTRMCEQAPAGWENLHYYEHFEPDGQTLRRRKVGLAGTGFYEINDDETLRLLKSGLVAEATTAAVANDRLHVTSPSNEPFKFDGNVATQWGLTAPGSQQTVLEDFSDHTAFTVAGGTKANAVGLPEISADGSVAVNKTLTAADTVTIERTGLSLDFQPDGQTFATIGFYVPAGGALKLRQTAYCLEVRLTEGANINRYRFDVGQLFEGANLLTISLNAPDVDGSPNLSAIDTIAFDIILSAPAVTHDDFRWDHLYITDPGAPSVSLGAAGSVDTTRSYRVTFVSKNGVESNAGPVSLSAAATAHQVLLDDLPISDDPQVIARRIYADSAGNSVFRFVAQIDDNTTVAYTDNAALATLGSVTPPLTSDSSKDYSPPPRMRQVLNYLDYMVGINADKPSEVVFSYKFKPETFPFSRRRQFNFEVKALVPHLVGLMIVGTDRMVLVTGTDWQNFFFRTFSPGEGNVAVSGWRAWTPYKRIAVLWHDDGPYSHDGGDPWYLAQGIRDQIEALDGSTFGDLILMHDRRNFRLVAFVNGEVRTFTYPEAQGQVSSVGGGVDPLDVRKGRWNRATLPVTVNCAAIMERDDDRPEMWVGCSDGFVYWLGDPSAIDYANGYGQSAIASDFRTNWGRVGDDITIHARFLSFSAEATVKSRWTAVVEMAREPSDDKVVATDTLTFDIGPGPRRTSSCRSRRVSRVSSAACASATATPARMGSSATCRWSTCPGASGGVQRERAGPHRLRSGRAPAANLRAA